LLHESVGGLGNSESTERFSRLGSVSSSALMLLVGSQEGGIWHIKTYITYPQDSLSKQAMEEK